MIRKRYKLKPLFKHQLMVTILSVVAVVVITLSGSFAVFSKTKGSDNYNKLTVGKLELSYVDLSDNGNVLELNNKFPVDDETGSSGSSYRFSVENTGSIPTKYYLVIEDDNELIAADKCSTNILEKSNIRYKLDQNDIGTLSDLEANDWVFFEGQLEAGESDIHELRIWIKNDSGNEVLGQHYHGKVKVKYEQESDEFINTSIKNDYKTLAYLAGLNPSNYDSIESLFADENAINEIVSKSRAIDYLVTSKDDMKTAALASTTLMTSLLGDKTALYSLASDSDWYSSIMANNTTKTLLVNNSTKIAKMTDASTCEGEGVCGTASASDETNTSEKSKPFCSFDRSKEQFYGWRTASKNPASESEYLQFEFNDEVLVYGLDFFDYNNGGVGMYYSGTTNATISYSLDGETWIDIGNYKFSPGTDYSEFFTEAVRTKYMRFKITGNNGTFSYTSTSYWYSITEMNYKVIEIPE